jgi:hypothetical protein
MTRKEIILNALQENPDGLSCVALTQIVIASIGPDNIWGGNKIRYMSGSVSSILLNLVRHEVLEYAEQKGPRGGHIYKIKTNGGI